MSDTGKDKMTLFDEFMEDQDFARLERQEEFILVVTESIVFEMERRGITRSDLAERMGKTRSSISQYLNGSRNLTCRTVADIVHAVGCKPHFELLESATEQQADTRIGVVVDFPYDARRPSIGIGDVGTGRIGGNPRVEVHIQPHVADWENRRRLYHMKEGTA
jgi:transcriptional regulator with XRE-family HTH domain